MEPVAQAPIRKIAQEDERGVVVHVAHAQATLCAHSLTMRSAWFPVSPYVHVTCPRCRQTMEQGGKDADRR